MQRRFTIQTALTVAPHRLVQHEREYVVAPCSMIVEGVLNEALVPGDAIRACHWDGMPVVINHPMQDGAAISAQRPEVAHVGRVFHTQVLVTAPQGHDLVRAQAELWLEVAQLQTLGGEAVQALAMLESQTPMEVSTAFYSQAEQTRGSFYGVPYQEIHHALIADHLALLPNSIGACNWQDGCGAPRLNAQDCACAGPLDQGPGLPWAPTQGQACTCEEGLMESPTPRRMQALWVMLRDFFGSPVIHLRGTARRPTYTGTENTPWSAPTFQVYTHALFSGAAMPASVADCTEAQKRQIAAHTLLGEATASTFSAISFFPVVNPRTGKLNARALRAVLSGRGSQANIPAAALASAQAMARGLLQSEFDAPATNQTDVDLRESLYGALARALGDDVYMTPYFIQDLDIAAQTFTYRKGERLVQRRWTTDAQGLLTLGPEEQDVQRDTRYLSVPAPEPGSRPGQAAEPVTEEEAMPIPTVLTRRVDALIANVRSRWSEADRHMLERCDEAMLVRLEQQPLDAPADPTRPPATLLEAIAAMPQHLQEPMSAMAEEYEQRKAASITVLLANKQCPFDEAELQSMTAQRLEQLVAMAGDAVPLRPGQLAGRDYSGRGMPHRRPLPEDEEPPPAPNTFARVVELQRARGVLA